MDVSLLLWMARARSSSLVVGFGQTSDQLINMSLKSDNL